MENWISLNEKGIAWFEYNLTKTKKLLSLLSSTKYSIDLVTRFSSFDLFALAIEQELLAMFLSYADNKMIMQKKCGGRGGIVEKKKKIFETGNPY